jgi:hypothetical protein
MSAAKSSIKSPKVNCSKFNSSGFNLAGPSGGYRGLLCEAFRLTKLEMEVPGFRK